MFTFYANVPHNGSPASKSEPHGPATAEALLDFYRSQVPSAQHDHEPVKKKRRVSHNVEIESTASLGTEEMEMNVDCVTLAHVELRLHFEQAAIPANFHAQQTPTPSGIPVIISGVDKVPNCEKSLRFTLRGMSGKKDHSITLSCGVTNIVDTLTHLRNLSSVTPFRPRGNRLKVSNLAWSECCLIVQDQGETTNFQIHGKIKWRSGVTGALLSLYSRYKFASLLRTYMIAGYPVRQDPWSPRDFYSNVHVPDQAQNDFPPIQSIRLKCQLYPFQKRAVAWLLRQEGVQMSDDGTVIPCAGPTSELPLSFHPTEDADGRFCYVSHLLGEVRTNLNLSARHEELQGGILAEEMGLGKTVELISLLCLHQRQNHLHDGVPKKLHDNYTGTDVFASPATLIVTPSVILTQWISELKAHVPSLRILHYEGMNGSRGKRPLLTDDELRETLLDQDVVLTTYNVLSREIHYAKNLPDRALRNRKQTRPRRSPLMQISWWRVCLDEAQMVESTVSNAATVARLIPRCNAWAVSGTPMRKNIEDLFGLLIFLRYEPFSMSEIWIRMIAGYKDVFAEIFNGIAVRHTKNMVRQELCLPPQKRVVITIPFTAIEEQRYAQMFQDMCEDCGLSVDGAPIRQNWDPHSFSLIDKMRTWLTRLRQTCLHYDVGNRNRRALGYKDGPLRTVDEVLEVMIDQNETAIRSEERAVVTAKITCGHMLSFAKGNAQLALDCYMDALANARHTVVECRDQLAQEQKKTRDVADTKTTDIGSDHYEDDVDEQTDRVSVCRQHLRAALEMEHVCFFFLATGYYQVKEDPKLTEPNSSKFQELEEKETESYEKAKQIRKELLQDTAKKATKPMHDVATAKAKSFVKLPPIQRIDNIRGIESRKITDSVKMIRSLLNAQAKQFEEWRQKLVDLLLVKLVDQEEDQELNGKEYEASTKEQDEVYVLLDGLRTLIADRHCMVTGQANGLIDHEMKEALKQAQDGKGQDELRGHAPELLKEILRIRETLRLPPSKSDSNPASIRGIMADVRSAITAVGWQDSQGSTRAALEISILEQELQNLQQISNAQMKLLASLEKELHLFRSTMNQRLEFYKQLQHISDQVTPWQEEIVDEVDQRRLGAERRNEVSHAEKIASLMTKRKFLMHLRTESSGQEEQRICVICQSPFEIGVLTVCGHQYCKFCLGLWWNAHRNCPTCKRHLALNDIHDITYKPREIQAQEESQTPTTSDDTEHGGVHRNPNSSGSDEQKFAIYSDISSTTFSEIKSIDLSGPTFGTKIDTISRHLLWLRQHDPGAKSIIFSQYREFLSILGHAFKHFKIGFAEISNKDGVKKFKEDPAAEAFLLHAKADSSGLNLVNATHVLLCEPLINASIELQAIARVHRIGQRRMTTVWMYLVSDTVEEAIYDISVKRRMAHMQRTTSAPSGSRSMTPAGIEEGTLDAANSLELQTAPVSQLLTKGQSGGEVVNKSDLWSCLFTKVNRQRGAVDGVLEDGLLGREVGRHLRAEAAQDRGKNVLPE